MFTITATRAGHEIVEYAPVPTPRLGHYLHRAQATGADTIRVVNRQGQSYTLHPKGGTA